MGFTVFMVVAIIVLLYVTPPVSIRSNRGRARELGASWVGRARICAGPYAPPQAPVIREALKELRPRFKVLSYRYPWWADGRLYVFRDVLRWQPTLRLGPGGKAKAWQIPLADALRLHIAQPFWPFPEWRATILTPEGDIGLIVVDPAGLQRSLLRNDRPPLWKARGASASQDGATWRGPSRPTSGFLGFPPTIGWRIISRVTNKTVTRADPSQPGGNRANHRGHFPNNSKRSPLLRRRCAYQRVCRRR